MADSSSKPRYRLLFTVPQENVEACKSAIFAVGAGVWNNGDYVEVSFEAPGGVSQYREVDPKTKALGPLVTVDELKVDVMCVGREIMLKAVEALKKAHPHGTVDYAVYAVEDV